MTRFEGYQLKKQIIGKYEPKDWMDTLADRIDSGQVLPIISNKVSNDFIFGSHRELIELWANYIDYPFNNISSFPRTMLYHTIMNGQHPGNDHLTLKKDYFNFLESALRELESIDQDLLEKILKGNQYTPHSFSKTTEELGLLPQSHENPFSILAELPLPIYLTTSYHQYLETALRKVPRKFQSQVFNWTRAAQQSVGSDLFWPSQDVPLVYHLHGRDNTNELNSLVLTEDDYLDFLYEISHKELPASVLGALSESSIVLLGYSLGDWDSRVLIRGLLKPTRDKLRPKSVAIQLDGTPQEKAYWERYLEREVDFQVYWGDTTSFLKELWQRWSGDR